MDVKAFHPYRQRPMLKNSCEDNPCQSLCLLSPDGGYICACPGRLFWCIAWLVGTHGS